jgi:hypothetical protein
MDYFVSDHSARLTFAPILTRFVPSQADISVKSAFWLESIKAYDGYPLLSPSGSLPQMATQFCNFSPSETCPLHEGAGDIDVLHGHDHQPFLAVETECIPLSQIGMAFHLFLSVFSWAAFTSPSSRKTEKGSRAPSWRCSGSEKTPSDLKDLNEENPSRHPVSLL